MKEIKLTQNKVALIDDDLYPFVRDIPFHAVLNKAGNYYARSCRKLIKGKNTTYLHWLSIPPIFSKSFQIRFINGNTLDCRRDNLEYISKTSNTQKNSKTQKERNKSSKYLGVSKECDNKKRKKIWAAKIKFNNKIYRLGRFLTENEAAEKYNQKAVEFFGEKAKLNLINI